MVVLGSKLRVLCGGIGDVLSRSSSVDSIEGEVKTNTREKYECETKKREIKMSKKDETGEIRENLGFLLSIDMAKR